MVTYPTSWRVDVDVAAARNPTAHDIHCKVAVTQTAPDDAPEPDGYICGACGRLMPDPDGWHTLPLPAHPAAPTLVCAPCHAAGRLVH